MKKFNHLLGFRPCLQFCPGCAAHLRAGSRRTSYSRAALCSAWVILQRHPNSNHTYSSDIYGIERFNIYINYKSIISLLVRSIKRRSVTVRSTNSSAGHRPANIPRTFISTPLSPEQYNMSQLKLFEDNRMMTILIQRDGEWEAIKMCRSSSIINAITEVRRENPGRK